MRRRVAVLCVYFQIIVLLLFYDVIKLNSTGINTEHKFEVFKVLMVELI